MFTVAVQTLKFMIAVIFAVFPNMWLDYCWHFSGTWISCKNINAPSFLVPTTFGAQFFFHLCFCQSLRTLQCSLSATAEQLVKSFVVFGDHLLSKVTWKVAVIFICHIIITKSINIIISDS